MIIVGGTYDESIEIPEYGPARGGSGHRAALAVGEHCEELVTALAPGEALADVRGRTVERTKPVGFSYFTPVSRSRIIGLGSALTAPIDIDHDDVLTVGLIESGEVRVRAKRVVIDPQSPEGDSRNVVEVQADEQILSANAREVASLLTDPSVPYENAARVRDIFGYEAVVLRAGAQGCFVADKDGVHSVPAHPTMRVWTLGSGDTFSGAFAAAWAAGADPVEAAHVGSNATAWWCLTRDAAVPADILDGTQTIEQKLSLPAPDLVGPKYSPAIYLAAPFFTVAERWLVNLTFRTLQGLGARPFSPLHHVGLGGDDVAQRDIEGLDRCDAVFAILDHYDAGTVFETGWASARHTPVIGFRSDSNDEGDKMLVGLGAEIHTDLTTALYRSVWAALGAQLTPGRHSVAETR
jgi:hypothetical protein